MDDGRAGRRIALLLVGGSGLVSVARGMSLAFLAVRLQQSFDLTPAQIGALLGIGPLLGAIAAPPAGALSDRVGRRVILTLVLLVMALALVGMGLAQSILVFCVAQVAAAVAGAIYEPVSRALMSDVCPGHLRLRYFSWRYLATNVGWGIGPLIGVAVGAASAGLFVAAGLAYAVFAAALALTATGTELQSRLGRPGPSKVSILRDLGSAMRDPRLVFFLAGGTLLIAVHGQWSVSLSQYLTGSFEDGVRAFAMLVSVNAVVVLAANRLSRTLITRAGALPSLVLGCLLFLAGEIGFLVSGSLWGLTAAMVLFSLGEVLVVPAEYVLIDGISNDANRGSYFGAQALSSIGNFVGPTIGGMMLSAFGGPGMFLFFALLAALSAALFAVGSRMPPPSPVVRGGKMRATRSTGRLALLSPIAVSAHDTLSVAQANAALQSWIPLKNSGAHQIEP